MHLCAKHTSPYVHVFSIKQTGRNIMVSGRNGVRFPIGPAAPWWAMVLKWVQECVFTHGYARERVCLRLSCFHRSVGGRSGTHPSYEQRADCAADRVGWLARVGPGEKIWQDVFPLKPHCDRWQRDRCHIIFLHTSQRKTIKDKIILKQTQLLYHVCFINWLLASIIDAINSIYFEVKS